MIIDDMIKDKILAKDTTISFATEKGMSINSAFERSFLELLKSNYLSIGDPRESIAITVMGYCPQASIMSKACMSDIIWNILNNVPLDELKKEQDAFMADMEAELAKRKMK